MGCLSSKPAPPPSPTPSPTPSPPLAPGNQHVVDQNASQARSRPDTAAQAPFSNRSRGLAIDAAQPPSRPLYHSKGPGMPVPPPSQHVAGLTTYPPAQPNMETSRYRTHEYDEGRHAPSSFHPIPVDRTMSAQPLSQWGSPIPSSHTMVRTMSAGHPLEAKFEDTSRNHARSTHGINKGHVANDSGHQRLPSVVGTILSDNLRFRILVIGKKSSGKSSLINYIFNVNMSTAPGNISRTSETGDINAGFAPSENPRLIVHEYSSFEPGVVQNMSAIREFIIFRTRTNCPASERLHAVWICVPTSDVIAGNLGDGVGEILGLSRVVPVAIVATKFDVVVSQVLFDIARGDTRFSEEARNRAFERYRQSCRSLFPRDTMDVTIEAVSTKTKFEDFIIKLITTTHKLVAANPCNGIMPSTSSETQPANVEIAHVPLMWSIAQRISHDLIIQASIEVGRSRYWRSLWSSQDFTDQIFEECINIIHIDIVGVWSLRDEEGYLLGRKFKTKMYDLVKDLTVSLPSRPSGMPDGQASRGAAGWASASYQNSIEDIRCVMGYIVDLTVILYGLFVSGHDVSASRVHEVMNHHVRSGLREHIHQDISRFVTEEATFIYRGRDMVMEKIIDLIRQSCVPRQNA